MTLDSFFSVSHKRSAYKVVTLFVIFTTILWAIGVPFTSLFPMPAKAATATFEPFDYGGTYYTEDEEHVILGYGEITGGTDESLISIGVSVTGANGFDPTIDFSPLVPGESLDIATVVCSTLWDGQSETFNTYFSDCRSPGQGSNVDYYADFAGGQGSNPWTWSFAPFFGSGSISDVTYSYVIMADLAETAVDGHSFNLTVGTDAFTTSAGTTLPSPVTTDTIVIGPAPSPPSAPTNLVASASSYSQIDLSWNTVGDATSYTLYRSTTSGSGYSQIYNGSNAFYSDTGLDADTTYYYVVSASNAVGEGDQSIEAMAVTQQLPSPPSAPSSLQATAINSGQINLTWNAEVDADGYILYRSETSGSGYAQIYSGVANSYNDTGVSAETTYYYVVKATNAGGQSANSTEANATTPVQGAVVSAISATSVPSNALPPGEFVEVYSFTVDTPDGAIINPGLTVNIVDVTENFDPNSDTIPLSEDPPQVPFFLLNRSLTTEEKAAGDLMAIFDAAVAPGMIQVTPSPTEFSDYYATVADEETELPDGTYYLYIWVGDTPTTGHQISLNIDTNGLETTPGGTATGISSRVSTATLTFGSADTPADISSLTATTVPDNTLTAGSFLELFSFTIDVPESVTDSEIALNLVDVTDNLDLSTDLAICDPENEVSPSLPLLILNQRPTSEELSGGLMSIIGYIITGGCIEANPSPTQYSDYIGTIEPGEDLSEDGTYYVYLWTGQTPTEGHQVSFNIDTDGVTVDPGGTATGISSRVSTATLTFGTVGFGDTFSLKGYGPTNGDTNIPNMAPVDMGFLGVLNDSVLADLDSYFSITPTVQGNWEAFLENNWGNDTFTRVSFIPDNSLALDTEYTVTLLKSITDTNDETYTVDLFGDMAALDDNGSSYSFSFTTSSTETAGGAWPPGAFPGYPGPGMRDIGTGLGNITINFDRDNMDATTFGGGNIYLAKMVNGTPSTVSGTSVIPSTGTSDIATITGFTLDPNSQYRVFVTRGVKDTTGQQLMGMPLQNGDPGPFYYDFYTSGTSAAISANFIGSNLDMYNSGGSLVNVPTGIIINAAFDQPLDPATVNTSSVTLTDGGAVSGSVSYNAQANAISFIPDAVLSASTQYTFAISTDVTSITGSAISAVSKVFTTGSADSTKPAFVHADADNYGVMMEFSEPIVESLAEAKTNYTLKIRSDATDWGSVTARSLTSANVRYEPAMNMVFIDGLTLTPGNEFQITASTNITDYAGNSLDDTAGVNVKTGVVFDASLFAGDGGMNGLGDFKFEDFNMGDMGMMPINVMPMNNLPSLTTKYFIDIPIATQIPADGVIELKFPAGFNVTGVTQDAQSPINDDFNGPETGNAVTFDNTDPANTSSNGVVNDGIGVIGERTIVVKLSAATQSSGDFLHFDLDGIVNTAVPKGFETDGYQVEIRTKNASGVLLEALNSLPFFIMGGGTNTISGEVHGVANGDGGTIKVILDSSMTGPILKLVTITGTGDAAADGSFSFENLPDGEYFLFTNPSVVINSSTYYGNPAPDPLRVGGGSTATRNITLEKEGTGSTTDYTVTLIGDFTTNGVNDEVDIFAGSPTGFRVKTVTPGNTAGTDYHLYLPAGQWMVGVGPAMPNDPGAGPPPMPDWMPPQPTPVISTGSGTGALTINLGSQTVRNVIGQVLDGSGNPIAQADVFAYQPNGGFGGANTRSASDGSFTLKIPVTGQYIIGAFKPGLPDAKEKSIEVLANTDGTDGNATADVYLSGTIVSGANPLVLRMKRPSYTITGKVLSTTGTGMAGVPVWAYQPTGGGQSGTMTDASGNYILYVDNGSWQIETDIPGYGWVQKSSLVTIEGASQSGINLRPDSSLSYYTITGTVTIGGTAQAYRPIRAVKYDANGNYLGQEYGSSTDANGQYSITAPAGIYRVDIWTPEYGEVGRTDADDYANSPANVDLTSGNKSGVNITIATGDLNDVTIVFNNKEDYANIEAFISVDGIDVSSGGTLTGFFKNKRISDISQTSASTTIKLEDGNYHFFANVPGQGEFIPIEGGPTANTPGYIDVGDSSADSNTVTFDLPDLDSGAVTINGTVTANTNPVQDAWVWVGNPDTGYHRGTSTNASGQYSLQVPILTSGSYHIGADKPGYNSDAPSEVDLTDDNADGIADNEKDFGLVAYGATISGYIYADAAGGTTNQLDAGEEVPNGWVYAEEINTYAMAQSPVDGSGYYELGVSDGTWRIYGAADGYQESQYSINGTASTLTVVGSSLTGKNIKLQTNANWSSKTKNKPMTPSSGGIFDDTATSGTGVKVTVPANAFGSSSDAGSLSVTNTSSVAPTSSATPFGGLGKSITATDSSGQPITNLNDYIDIEMVYWKNDIDELIDSGGLVDYNKLKTLMVSYFDAAVNDWVTLPTVRTAYYKTNSEDTEWKTYVGDATRSGFKKFIDDALVNETFTAFEDYKLVFKTSTDHLTIFGVTTPTDAVAPAAPTSLSQTSGNGSSVVLDWNDNSEADLMEYEIYRSTSTGVGTSDTQVNTSQVTSSTFTDSTVSSWTSYYYTVTAVDTSGNESTVATEIQVCSNTTVANGTVADSCTITCDSGYVVSGNSCTEYVPGGGGGAATFTQQPVEEDEEEDVEDEEVTEEEVEEEVVEETQLEEVEENLPASGLADDEIFVKPAVKDIVKEVSALKDYVALTKSLPADSNDWRMLNFIAYGNSNKTMKLTNKERVSLLEDYRSVYKVYPSSDDGWEQLRRISQGETPVRIASREANALREFIRIFGRLVDFSNRGEEKFIHTVAYRLRPADRDLEKERMALQTFIRVYKRLPSSSFTWSIIRALAYSGI